MEPKAQHLHRCRGLDYLHTGTDQSFIHRDVKTTNILLDENLVAKISDFGLSKGTTSNSATHVTTKVKGTFGYLDPDYFYTHRLTKKSDVYAFGVVLLEVLCGRPPVDTRLEEDEISLILWAQQHIKEEMVDRIIDTSLIGQITPQSLKYFVEVFRNGLHNGPNERPTMAEVVGTLDLALVSQRKGRREGIIGKVFKGIGIVPKHTNLSWREKRDNGSKCGPSENLFCELLSDGVTRPPRHFSLAQIRAATNDFNRGLLIKEDMLNMLYRGCMDGKTSNVLINRFRSFWAFSNIEAHSLLENHPHIVSLIGFFTVERELIGVYDYMENGSLEDHLFNTKTSLPWKRRLKICIGAAQGLQHLHENAKPSVIHGDINPANILLDKNWVAKLFHFGYSELLYDVMKFVRIRFQPRGGIGYVAPEFSVDEKLTTKTDVYSFGMVLFSVLSAKKPLDKLGCKSFVCRFMMAKTFHQVIDPNLLGKIAPKCLKKFVNIAFGCLLDQANQRPSIDIVVSTLDSALQIQEAWENHFGISAE